MTFAGPQLQRLLLEFGDKMGDFCGDERILAENRRLNVAWGSTQLRLYWRKEGVYASYTRDGVPQEVLDKHGLAYDPKYLDKYVDQSKRDIQAEWDDEMNLIS